MLENRKSGQFVVPGERLGVIEEFTPNSGTYVEDGVIYSKNAGYVLMDFENKKVSVYSASNNLKIPKVGSIVEGNVIAVQRSMATVKITKIGKKAISGFFTGLIHVSDVSFQYTENISDSFKVGDYVRAKVVSNKNRIFHLSTKGENLGVIYASCSKCGNLLTLRNKILQCGVCGNFEKRRTAPNYGVENL
ncbi:MAG: exosome complex RNA-binding protein Csl4 [Candidatus Bathyarchaeia archaeon]